MNNQIHSQGSQRLSTSVSLYFFYCHFHFIVKPTLLNLLLSFFLNAYLLTFPEVEPPVQDISAQAEFRIFSFSWRNKLLQGVLPHWSCSSLVNCSFQSWIIYFESPHTLWWYFTQPRTTAYPFEICGQAVRKTRSAIMCKECSVWFYQACSYIILPWRSTHHTLGHVATAAWQVFPRQCFHLVLLPVTDLIRYLTFLLPPLETQQAHKLHLPICSSSVFPCTCLVLLIRRQSKRKEI